eukprot:5781179-Alexandrium_andersonii.AAC.1
MRVRMPMLAPNARMRNHWATQAITARSHCSFFATTAWLQVAHLDTVGIEPPPVTHASGTIPGQPLRSLKMGLYTRTLHGEGVPSRVLC